VDERTQGALLLAVGGVALRLGLTDAALSYVKAGLQPLLIITGVVLVVLGAAAVLHAFRVDPAVEHEVHDNHGHAAPAGPAPEGHHDGHGHAGHGPGVAWLMVLPLLAILLVAPPPLGAFAAGRQSDRPPTTTQTTYPPLPDAVEGAVPLTMSEYVFRALYDEDRSLEGQRIRLTGFVSETGAEGYELTRFVLNCCAADGRPVSVVVTGDAQPRAADTWLEVEGTWQPREGVEPGEASAQAPLFVAESAHEVAQPDQPYEY
jgi:uncharacterized repeat protein (TIGR03943 family)